MDANNKEESLERWKQLCYLDSIVTHLVFRHSYACMTLHFSLFTQKFDKTISATWGLTLHNLNFNTDMLNMR